MTKIFTEGSLARVEKNLDLSYLREGKKEKREKNNYIERSILDFEMPRLMAQSRSVFKHLSYYLPYVYPIFPKTGTILDIGAGPGVLTGLLFEKFFPNFRGLALELSEYMYKFGSVFCLEAEWSKGSVYNMPYKSKSIDFIFSSFVFMHLSDPQKALSEIFRVLKKGGILLVVNTDYSATAGSSRLFSDMMRKYTEYVRSKNEGDYHIMKYLQVLAYKEGLELVEREYTIFTNDHVNQSGFSVEFPFFSMGRMLCWNYIAILANRAKENDEIYNMYQELQREYMGNKIFVKIRVPIHIYKK